MSALAAAKRRKPQIGNPLPRIAPPMPLKHDLAGFRKDAEGMGIKPMPWQENAARYITAKASDGKHLFREVCVLVARQQGKTTLAKPIIVRALRDGLRVMHIAQSRELPRHMFGIIADALSAEPELFPKRRGKVVWPRYGAGQEEIVLANGGSYRIAAATTGGPRGWSNDLVIIDELREMDSTDVMGAVEPTMTMSPDPLTIYLSNAGHEKSVVLNGLRARAGSDPSLAWLEWSAEPDLAPDDMAGWLQANPAIGHFPNVLAEIEKSYRAHLLSGTLAIFETERLCRWVVSMQQRFVDAEAWADQPADVGPENRVQMAVSYDPSGERASVATAWRNDDESISLAVVLEATGKPIDVDRFGPDVKMLTSQKRAVQVAYDPWTDVDLARHLVRARAINGRDYANASMTFARLVDDRKLRMDDETREVVGRDLARLTRRSTQGGSFMAVRGNDQEPATAALAAIRAVWLAAAPTSPIARIY